MKQITINFKRVSSLMLSFNIHEITIFIMNEDHKQLLISICLGLFGPVGKNTKQNGLAHPRFIVRVTPKRCFGNQTVFD